MTNECRLRVRVLLVIQLAGRSALRNDAGGESFHATKYLPGSHLSFSHHALSTGPEDWQHEELRRWDLNAKLRAGRCLMRCAIDGGEAEAAERGRTH